VYCKLSYILLRKKGETGLVSQENNTSGAPLALDGRRLFGRHNNQITVDESGARGDEGEMRPGWSVWDGAVASVRPSN